jgi:hypothetical protein
MFLIIILIVVLVYIALQQRVEGFKSDTFLKDKKALICYYGGSFREGNIGSTKRDSKYGYDAQKNTSISHAKLKQVLNEKGYQTDILISTRNTKYSNYLDSWYEPYHMIINKMSEKIHGKDYMIKATVDNINKLNKFEYDFILFVRIDLFLKPDFFEVLDTETNKISFLANNYNPKNCNHRHKDSPEVVDLFVLIPKKYYYILDSKFSLNHDSWNYLKRQYKLTDDDMTFMSNLMFDSNSTIDQNQYNVMSSRKENKKLHTDKTSDKPIDSYCPKYLERSQTYIDNPSKYYIEKHVDFYNV